MEDSGDQERHEGQGVRKNMRTVDYTSKCSGLCLPTLSTGAMNKTSLLSENVEITARKWLNHQITTEEVSSATVENGLECQKRKEGVGAADAASAAVVTFTGSSQYVPKYTLWEYQIQGLHWIINLFENGMSGILGDESGLGKVAQTISFIRYLKLHKVAPRSNSLVIVPTSELSKWEIEMTKWCPGLRHISLTAGSSSSRERRQISDPVTWDVLLTTYEMVVKENFIIRNIYWTCVVVDKAHEVKHHHHKLADAITTLESRCRLLLTGVPLNINLHQLWPLINLIFSNVGNSEKIFNDWLGAETSAAANPLTQELQRLLQPFYLRRIKADLEKTLTPFEVFIPLSNFQPQCFSVEKDELFFGLKQLFPPWTIDDYVNKTCAKMMLLDNLLLKLQSEGSRVLLFSRMEDVLHILEDYFILRKFCYQHLDGKMVQEHQEQKMCDEFNSASRSAFIFMTSARDVGLGIHLAIADVIIQYDSDCTHPQLFMDLQAIGLRKQKVRVFRFITSDKAEEIIVEKVGIVKMKLGQQLNQIPEHTELHKQTDSVSVNSNTEAAKVVNIPVMIPLLRIEGGDDGSNETLTGSKTWTCPNCQYITEDRLSWITKHLKIHENAKYQCKQPGCSAKFRSKTTLTKHILSRHGDLNLIGMMQPQRKVVCPDCQEKFLTISALNRHKRDVHKGDRLCDTCQAPFRTKARLTKHRQYTGH